MSDTLPPFGRAPSATTTMLKRAPQRVALANAPRDVLEVVRNLRDQDHVGAAGHAAVQRNPAGVPPHDLDHHDPPVRFGGRVQAVDGVGREAHGRVEAETAGRADDVVVDRLGHADERNAPLVELVGDRQRAVAADADERVETRPLEHLHHAVGVVERALGRHDRLGERVRRD